MRKVTANDEVDKLPSSIKSLLYDSTFLKDVADKIAVLDPGSQLLNESAKQEAGSVAKYVQSCCQCSPSCVPRTETERETL